MAKQRVIMTYPADSPAVMSSKISPRVAGTITGTRRIGSQVLFEVTVDQNPDLVHRRVPADFLEFIDMSDPEQVERWLDV